MASNAARGWRLSRKSALESQTKRPLPPGRKAGPSEEEKAAERRAQLRRQEVQRRFAIGCFLVGVLMIFTHWLRHLEVYALSIDPALQDLTIGYGSGALLIMLGLYKLP